MSLVATVKDLITVLEVPKRVLTTNMATKANYPIIQGTS